MIRLKRVIDYDGRVSTLAYTNELFPRLVTSVTDPHGRIAQFEYDTNANLVATGQFRTQYIEALQRADQGVLAREILIERADAHPRPRRDGVGGEALMPQAFENASRRFQDDVHGRGRAGLARLFARLGAGGAVGSGHRRNASSGCELMLAF